MEIYDVVIIGAGPAGLRASQVLSRNGKKVLVLEKNTVPCQKICAEGVTSKTLKLHYFPRECITKKFYNIEAIFFGKRKISFSSKEPLLCSINRVNMGKTMSEEAIKHGSTIKYCEKVLSIKKETDGALIIETDKNSYKSKQLIGAEGMHSVTRNFLNIPVSKCGFGIQYKIRGYYKNLELHLNTKFFGPLYCWIFPNDNFFYLGTGSEKEIMTPNQIKTNLSEFCKKHKINIDNAEIQSAGLNIDYQGFKFGNIFLAGESAGLVQNLTGEGIYNALVSGDEIANLILDPSFETKEINEMIESKRDQERLKQIYNFCPTLISFIFFLAPFLAKIPIIKRRFEKAAFH